jgi:RNA recognition motif-containing protein
MTRTKVFVGNLSFKTNEKDLAKEFEAAGKVANASIISRGTRSLGYGFVEMESEEEARKSVELLNKKLIDDREINVEIARPREEKPAQDNTAAPAGNGAPAGEGAVRGGRGRGRGGRGRGRFFRRGGRGGAVGGGPANAEGGNAPAPAQNNNAAAGAPAGAAPQRERRPRAPRAPRNEADKTPRTPSNDTLFVANLPFSIDDAGLATIFEGLNIKAAHVVRKHNERSKGFGFVEFHNHDDQLAALNKIDKKQVDNRELSVKVALTEVPRNGAAPAAGAPAAAPEANKQ